MIYLLLLQSIRVHVHCVSRIASLNCETKVVMPEYLPKLEERFIVHDKTTFYNFLEGQAIH